MEIAANKNRFDNIFLTGWRPYFWLALMGFALYLSTLFFNYTYLDDNALILNNYGFMSHLGNIPQVFKQQVFFNQGGAFYYRPLLTLSFMWDAQWSGTKPLGYHWTNIILHLAAALLLFLFFLKMDYSRRVSFFAALIFTAHPVLSQAVGWLPGRNDTLLAVFALASFIFFIDFIKTKKWPYYAAHLFLFFLALLTKESAVALPVLSLFFLIFIARDKLFSQNTLKIIFGWLVVGGIWWQLRDLALAATPQPTILYALKSIYPSLPALFIYLGKIVFPVNLSVLPIMADSTLVFGYAALALIAGFLVFSKNKNWALVIFGLMWFLLFLLPTFINPVPKAFVGFIEHRVYLPLIGFLFIIIEITRAQSTRLKLISVLIVLVTFLVLTSVHIRNFKDKISFWKNAATHSTHSPLAHRNLGAMYYLDGQLDLAAEEAKKALELNPEEEMAHGNLGLIYVQKGLFEAAEKEYKLELETNPFYDNGLFNLGLLYYNQGKFKEAEELWLKTIAVNPNYLGAYQNLAAYYLSQKDYAKADYYSGFLKQSASPAGGIINR